MYKNNELANHSLWFFTEQGSGFTNVMFESTEKPIVWFFYL